MRKLKNMWIVACLLQVSVVWAEKAPVDYVNPLIGTLSDFKLSAGNTYPAVAMGHEFLGTTDRKDGRWLAV